MVEYGLQTFKVKYKSLKEMIYKSYSYIIHISTLDNRAAMLEVLESLKLWTQIIVLISVSMY